MRAALLTREYPPEVYGGAGVHVTHLAAALRARIDLVVHCIGEPRPGAVAHQPWAQLRGTNPALSVLSADLAMAGDVAGFDVLHSHTWYTAIAGRLGQLLHQTPHVVTVHSLEPLRPWKAEQLGGGYALSSWCERSAIETADAVIAVSAAMAGDLSRCYPSVDPARVTVIHNGVDAEEFGRRPNPATVARYGLNPTEPYLLFVGRLTRQKGVLELLEVAAGLPSRTQLLLCASSPDTPQIEEALRSRLQALQVSHPGVRLVSEPVPQPDLVALLSGARAFLCPSIYEPLGIVNLEAMACGAAVVASAVGGIPEVVVDDVTGLLVEMDQGPGNQLVAGPGWADRFARAIDRLLADPRLAERLGRAGRERAVSAFSWRAVAERTATLYESLI